MAGWTGSGKDTISWDGTLNSKAGKIQHTPADEKDIVNKEYVDNISTKSAVDLFLTENSSDIATYFDMEINVVTAAKENIVQSITAGSTTLIGSFASILAEPEIDNVSLVESGVYELHIHAEGAVAKNLLIYAEFYKRTSGGTETLLGTTHDSGELTTSEEQYSVHATIPTDTAWVSGDRFVCKIYGRNNSAANRNITIYMEGDTASRIDFPAIIGLGNFLLKDGSNADTSINIGSESFTTTGLITGGGLSTTGSTITGNHGTASVDQVVNVCYGTGEPPVASGTTEGALFFKYTA